MKLTEKIEYLVKHSGYQVKEVADGIGVTRTVVYNWMLGRNRPKIESIRSIAKFFDVPTEWLLADEENELPPKVKAQEVDRAVILSESGVEAGGDGFTWGKPQVNQLHFFSVDSFIGLSPSQCTVYKAQDDSMSPLIRTGDRILIRKQRPGDRVENGRIYLLAFADNVVFRRVFLRINGDLVVSTGGIADGETVRKSDIPNTVQLLGLAVERAGKL